MKLSFKLEPAHNKEDLYLKGCTEKEKPYDFTNTRYRRFDIVNKKGEHVAEISFLVYNRPSCLFLSNIEILNKDYLRIGIAKNIIYRINKIINDRKIFGVLNDASNIEGFYQKFGWKRYKDTKYYIYGICTEEEVESAINLYNSI